MLSSRSRAQYANPSFISFAELVAVTGLSDSSVRSRLRREGIPVYQDPSDNRRVLLKKDDLNGLFDTPKLVERPARREEAA